MCYVILNLESSHYLVNIIIHPYFPYSIDVSHIIPGILSRSVDHPELGQSRGIRFRKARLYKVTVQHYPAYTVGGRTPNSQQYRTRWSVFCVVRSRIAIVYKGAVNTHLNLSIGFLSTLNLFDPLLDFSRFVHYFDSPLFIMIIQSNMARLGHIPPRLTQSARLASCKVIPPTIPPLCQLRHSSQANTPQKSSWTHPM